MERERGRAVASGRLILVSAVGAAAVLLLASLAHGRVQFPPAQNLSAAGAGAHQVQLAIDPQNRAIVVWQRAEGGNLRIQAVRIGAGGTAGAVQTISDPGENASAPGVAVDSQGRATVVWRASAGGNAVLRRVRLAADGTPGTITSITVGPSFSTLNPRAATDSQDRATVVWNRFDGADTRIEWRRIGANEVALGANQPLSAAGQDACCALVAIDSQDRATVVWRRSDGAKNRIQARRIHADGGLGLTQTLSPAGQSTFFPRLAIDSQGRTTVVWQRSDGTNGRVQAVRLEANGVPDTVRTLSAAGRDAGSPWVAVDPQDRATVVWQRSDGTNDRIQAVRLSAAGDPGSVRTLSPAGQDAGSPRVAVDALGRATVAWQRSVGAGAVIQATRLRTNGIPGSVQTLSATGQDAVAENPEMAIDALSRPTVVWERHAGGASSRVQSTRGALVPPDTQITFGPAPGQVTSASPTFAFAGIPAADVDGFQCRVDAGAFAPCTSPRTFGPLADGPHTFAVRAFDSDGADPTPAQRAFTVDSSLPPNGAPPDTTPPELTLSGRKRQRLRRAVKVRARCDERCALVARGRLVIGKPRRSARAPKKLRLRPARARIAAGETTRLKLRIKKKGRSLARRALRRGHRVRARLRVRATDPSGNAAAARRTVRLKRPARR